MLCQWVQCHNQHQATLTRSIFEHCLASTQAQSPRHWKTFDNTFGESCVWKSRGLVFVTGSYSGHICPDCLTQRWVTDAVLMGVNTCTARACANLIHATLQEYYSKISLLSKDTAAILPTRSLGAHLSCSVTLFCDSSLKFLLWKMEKKLGKIWCGCHVSTCISYF